MRFVLSMYDDESTKGVVVSKDGIELLEDYLYLIQEFTSAIGYDYIKTISAYTDDGKEFSHTF